LALDSTSSWKRLNTSGVERADIGVGGTEGPVATVLTVSAGLLQCDVGEAGGDSEFASGSEVREAEGR
jgi:hypothetical protein